MFRMLTFFLLISTVSFSQNYPQVVVIEEDSCIIFTLAQSRQMIQWDLQLAECKETLNLTVKESEFKDSVINVQNEQIEEYTKIDWAYIALVDENKELTELLEEERKLLKKEIRRQKVRKWLLGIGGFCTTAFATYLYIQK